MKFLKILILATLLPFSSWAQNKQLTVEEAVLKGRTSLAPERLSQVSWIPGTNTFTWIAKQKGKEFLMKEDARTLKTDTVISLDEFKEILFSANTDVPRAEKFPAFTWIDSKTFRLNSGNVYYNFHVDTKIINAIIKMPKEAENDDYEPINNRCAVTVASNLVILDHSSVSKNALDKNFFFKEDLASSDGSYGIQNGKAVHRNEFGITKGTFWSPLGNKIAYYKMYEGMVSDYPIMDFKNSNIAVNPTKYPMAGGASHQAKIWVKDFGKGRQFEVQTGSPPEQYLTNIAWSPDEEILYVAIVNRDQNEMKMNAYDGNTGVFIRTIFSETHPKYVEPEKPMVFIPNRKPAEFIWQSKRDGFNHLYLYDMKGRLIKQLTKGNFDVSELLGFDKEGNTAIYIAASPDGLERQVYSINLETGKTVMITHNPGVHSVVLSPDGNYFIDSYSNLTTPRRTTLMDVTGGELSILVNSPNPISGYQPCGVRIFQIPSADKKVMLNCRMIFPPQFDSTKKHPVLVYVYGGPHVQLVTNSWLGGADLWLYYMAQQGYVIFTLDNRGSHNRGIEFENATFKKLGTVEREDQLAGVEFLKRNKYVDSTRLGVYGWSFGGFMTINMMTRTNAFKTGVAGGPVIDWKMYEIMYTERYMRKPQDNKEGYEEANLMNYVKDLKGKLLIIHGTADETVVWHHTLLYIKKCIEEGVQVDYFVYPGEKHNWQGKGRVHLMQKVADYFKQNL
ncbi:MAG: DPP IV N-terminal domain-containing protein [Bacteroidia bacterium]